MSANEKEVKKQLDVPKDNLLLDALSIQSAPIVFTNLRRIPNKITIETTVSLDFLKEPKEPNLKPKKEDILKIDDIGLDVNRVYKQGK